MPGLWQQLLAGLLGLLAIGLIAWSGAHLHLGPHEEDNPDRQPGEDRERSPTQAALASVASPAAMGTGAMRTAQTVQTGSKSAEKQKRKRGERDRDGAKRKQRANATDEGRGPKRKDGETDEEFETRRQKRLERKLARRNKENADA